MRCLYFTESLKDQLCAYGQPLTESSTTFENIQSILTETDLVYLSIITNVILQYPSLKNAPLNPTNGVVEYLDPESLESLQLQYSLPKDEEEFLETVNCVVLRDNVLVIFPDATQHQKGSERVFLERVVKSMENTHSTSDILKSDIWQYLCKVSS